MESPHASSCVILKANINQFCIVDCPGAVCNTCGVSAGMDVCRRFCTQTSDDNCGEAAPLRGLSIAKLYHVRCTHALPCPTEALFISLFTEKTVFALMLIPFIASRYTYVRWFSLVSSWCQSWFSQLTSEENLFSLLVLEIHKKNTPLISKL